MVDPLKTFVLAIAFMAGCQTSHMEPARPQSQSGGTLEEQRITREQAIEIAKRWVEKNISKDATLETSETEDAFIVEWRTPLPENVRGPDYDAQVWVDKRTGKILKTLVGR